MSRSFFRFASTVSAVLGVSFAVAGATVSRALAGEALSCREGHVLKGVSASGPYLCSDGERAYGPFPEGMKEACRAATPDNAFCETTVWPLGRTKNARGLGACPPGTDSESGTPYCRDAKNMYGPFTASLRASCRTFGGGEPCETNAWDLAFTRALIKKQPKPRPGLPPGVAPSIDELLRRIEERRAAGAPTYQDAEGRGIFPARGERDARSEKVYLPFVLGPRRPVDQVVRQLYQLLPLDVKREVAFVIPDRFVQNPRAYLPYLKSRARVVVVASFVGVGDARDTSSPTYAKATARHAEELWQLEKTLEAALLLGKPVASIVLGMGDSTTAFGVTARAGVQAKADTLLSRLGLKAVATPVSFGADELVAVAFARMLPEKGVRIAFSNPRARHSWDGTRTTEQVIGEKLRQVGLRVEDRAPDFEAVVLSRRPDQNDRWVKDDEWQLAFDEALLDDYRDVPSSRARRLAIIDGRSFNGAWNARATLQRCDLLAYGSWGTFGNAAGQTLAASKILLASGNDVARKQLLLEAVAHDVFATGYAESQGGTLASLLAPAGVRFDHWAGYGTVQEATTVFRTLGQLVERRMKEHYRNTDCLAGRSLRVTPQLWRTFEAEVHLWPQGAGEVFGAGVHRTDLPVETFAPGAGVIASYDLGKLVTDGCCR